ncbi:MAG: carboxypeptidase-like regulatory domain-containing protein, partial [Isosphaeraceae bacterium]
PAAGSSKQPAPSGVPTRQWSAGIIRGFAPHPFLPVLVESHTTGPRLTWTNEASEFEITGLPAGDYRVRSLDLFGKVTFATGAAVRPEIVPSLDDHVRLWSKVDLDEPDSRQVMGFVRWENGQPAAKAVVFMQCSYNFRKYLRRVETDEHGFFRFLDVPGNEPYLVFALPPDDANAMRGLHYFGVGFSQREVWRELILHPHRVTGTIDGLVIRADDAPPEAPANTLLQLVRLEGQSERIAWTFRTVPSGRFIVSNVAHGRYRVQVTLGDGKPVVQTLPFDVGDGRSETIVRWPSP